jgi:hypothetical protein
MGGAVEVSLTAVFDVRRRHTSRPGTSTEKTTIRGSKVLGSIISLTHEVFTNKQAKAITSSLIIKYLKMKLFPIKKELQLLYKNSFIEFG